MADVKRNIYIEINGKEVTNSLSGLRGEIRNVERDIRNLNRNDKDYQETLRQHQQRLQAVRNEYAAARGELGQTPSLLRSIKNELGEVGTGMLKAFTVTAVLGSFVNGVKSAFDKIKEFDQAQADLAGILETTKAGVIGLTYEAIKLGAKLPFTSTEVSRAQLELAKLGKSMDEIKNMTPGVLNAAIAMGSDLAPAAELVAGQLNSYAEGSAQAGRYADILSNSTNVSATSFEYLATALPKVSKAASVANVSFEKLNATIGVLSDENIAAETSGTGFRNILLTASKEGVHYEKLLERVKNSTDQLRTATELFGKENAVVAVTLANSTEKIQRQTEALENSSGSAEKLAAEKMNSIEGDLKLFDSAIEGFILGIEKGDGAIGKFTRGIIQFGTELIGLITPTRGVTDELSNQQIAINELISKITASNIKEGERLDLLKQLKANYPEYIGQIDIEKVSNEELLTTLVDINKNYRERIALQLEIEKADKIREKRDSLTKRSLQLEANLRDQLFKVIRENKFDDMTVDFNNLEKSAREVMKRLKEEGKKTGWFSDYSSIENTIEYVNGFKQAESAVNDELDEQSLLIQDVQKANKLMSEEELQAYKERNEAARKYYETLDEFGKKKVTAIEGESSSEELSEKEIKRQEQAAERKRILAEKQKEREKEIFKKAEEEIDKIILDSLQKRETATLTGIAKEIKSIENKYAQELIKFKDHKARFTELEAAKDAEIAEVKRLKNVEYMLQQFEIEKSIEEEKEVWRLERLAENASSAEERQLLLIDKAKYVADLEIQADLEKELAKVENVEMAEDLKQAIRDKYDQKKTQSDEHFANAKKALNSKEVDWTKITEEEKQNIAKNSLNMASDAFNEGTGAWKAAKIAETTISTYQSATNSYNALSGIVPIGPALGAAAAALAIATGLKNVQKIASTKVPKMPSYYYGGPTGSGNPSLGGDQYGAYTGMTHADEWVAPAFMTQNPRYASTFQWLENERKQTLRGERTTNGNDNQLSSAVIALAASTMQLNEVLAGGIEAKANIGYKEINKMNQLNEDMNQSSKYSKVQ
ncbi:phage tail tape measure protein [Myroides odoratus]|uniref:phage tail tape measure protein n=1 Tax=Myroides odoratus TaxID=256 RepID=UPI003342029C